MKKNIPINTISQKALRSLKIAAALPIVQSMIAWCLLQDVCVLFYVLWMSFSQKPRQVPLTRAVNVWCFVLRHILRAFWEIVKTEVVSRKKQTNLVINTRTCIRFTSITHQTNLVSAQHSYQTCALDYGQKTEKEQDHLRMNVAPMFNNSFCLSVFCLSVLAKL